MEENHVPMIQIVVGGGNAVDMLKSMVSSMYVEWTDDLLETELPKEEDFASKEEYEKACKEFMVDLVDQAKEYKGDIFKGVLESYNAFLTASHSFDTEAKQRCEHAIDQIAKATSDMKRTGIMVLVLSLIFPQAIPFLILFNGPRILIDARAKKRLELSLSQTNMQKSQMDSIQDPLFWFTDSLRTDYHASNKELDELRKRALNGENVISELMEIMSPERLSLPRENILKEFEFLLPVEAQEETKEAPEEQKQFTKKEDKK